MTHRTIHKIWNINASVRRTWLLRILYRHPKEPDRVRDHDSDWDPVFQSPPFYFPVPPPKEEVGPGGRVPYILQSRPLPPRVWFGRKSPPPKRVLTSPGTLVKTQCRVRSGSVDPPSVVIPDPPSRRHSPRVGRRQDSTTDDDTDTGDRTGTPPHLSLSTHGRHCNTL